jgi:D-alanine-D-alanine ligase-like ATP-grasp enzyme
VHIPQSQNHYPYVTQSILRLAAAGRLNTVTEILVEPTYGYVVRLTYQNGLHRVIYDDDLGFNSSAARQLAHDKGHSKFMLRHLGIACPKGAEFLLPWWAHEIGTVQHKLGHNNLHTTDEAASYAAQHLRYPIYVKPVSGSRGINIFTVDNEQELQTTLELYQASKVRVALLEEALTMPDYRIVVFDDICIAAYRRVPMTVVGDGDQTIEQLIVSLRETYEAQGRLIKTEPNDPRILHQLAKQGLQLGDRLQPGEHCTVLPISNLSAGGTAENVTDSINPRWVKLAATIAANFGLRLCGLDLACADITAADSAYSVIEVNSSPGLEHFAFSSQAQAAIVQTFYEQALNMLPQ